MVILTLWKAIPSTLLLVVFSSHKWNLLAVFSPKSLAILRWRVPLPTRNFTIPRAPLPNKWQSTTNLWLKVATKPPKATKSSSTLREFRKGVLWWQPADRCSPKAQTTPWIIVLVWCAFSTRVFSMQELPSNVLWSRTRTMGCNAKRCWDWTGNTISLAIFNLEVHSYILASNRWRRRWQWGANRSTTRFGGWIWLGNNRVNGSPMWSIAFLLYTLLRLRPSTLRLNLRISLLVKAAKCKDVLPMWTILKMPKRRLTFLLLNNGRSLRCHRCLPNRNLTMMCVRATIAHAWRGTPSIPSSHVATLRSLQDTSSRTCDNFRMHVWEISTSVTSTLISLWTTRMQPRFLCSIWHFIPTNADLTTSIPHSTVTDISSIPLNDGEEWCVVSKLPTLKPLM